MVSPLGINQVPLPNQSSYNSSNNNSIRLPIQPSFNEARRGSLGATDPFLHSNTVTSNSNSTMEGGVIRRSSMDINSVLNSGPPKSDNRSRPNSSAGVSGAGVASFPGPSASYAFGSTFSAGQGEDVSNNNNSNNNNGGNRPYTNPTSALPTHMGGFRQGGATAGAENSFFDYSMRRHSLTNAGQSPERLPSIDANGIPSPSSSLKRKISADGGVQEGYTYPANGGYAAPYNKRRPSDQRRESMTGWEEERRGAPATWVPGGGQPGFSAPFPTGPSGEQFDAYYRPPYTEQPSFNRPDGESYGRRPSVPSISSIQGGSPSFNSPNHNDSYSSSRTAPPHPSVLLPPRQRSLSGTGGGSLDQSRSTIPMTASASYSNLPSASAAWARAGPLPPNAHGGARPALSLGSSLDPNSAYGPGGSKDTPYSRSPELRVSHKLAERKRRKEMAQLFDELRDSLPNDRGLKSSKWEILSKAVDFIVNLKEHNTDLARDNTMLRNHFGLGSGPQRRPLPGDSPPDQQLLNQNQQLQHQQQLQEQQHQHQQQLQHQQENSQHQHPHYEHHIHPLPLLPTTPILGHEQSSGMIWTNSNPNPNLSNNNNNNNNNNSSNTAAKSAMAKVLAAANESDRRRSPRGNRNGSSISGNGSSTRRGTRSSGGNNDEDDEDDGIDELGDGEELDR